MKNNIKLRLLQVMTMNGQMMKYDKYLDSLDTMEEPPFPDVLFDMRGLINYAKSKGVKIAHLSDEEKKKFVHPKDEESEKSVKISRKLSKTEKD